MTRSASTRLAIYRDRDNNNDYKCTLNCARLAASVAPPMPTVFLICKLAVAEPRVHVVTTYNNYFMSSESSSSDCNTVSGRAGNIHSLLVTYSWIPIFIYQ